MAKQSKYPPYEQAKAMALDLQLNSRSAYQKWHRETQCEYLPRFPERVYVKAWESWNAWLGTANVWRGDANQAPIRNLWDAVKWAQEFAAGHDINTMREWLNFFDEKKQELPADIPLRPDTRYVEWDTVGWPTWLGTTVRGRIESSKHSTALLAICSHATLNLPGNYYAIIQAEHGEAELRAILDANPQLKTLRMYKMLAEDKEAVFGVVNAFGRQEDNNWYIPRLNDFVFELDMMLMPYKVGQ